MHVHLIGVAGTGMGSLAGLLVSLGHRVTGSDVAFYPPMGDALVQFGVETMTGYRPENLTDRPDLVIVGNVCRSTNPEARAAIDGGLRYDSFPGAMEALFLKDRRRSLVVAGTHGKTTTSTLLAYLLDRTGQDPGFLVGGVPLDFEASFRAGKQGGPFVIEGDEYDSAFFEKKPKFWRYAPTAAILTSLEHDHIDIYPTVDSYREAFDGFVERMPKDGVLVAWAGDPEVRAVCRDAPCRVVYYGLDDEDTGDISPVWSAGVGASIGGAQPFDVFLGGTSAGRALSPLMGRHNVRNALAAFALAAESCGVSISSMLSALRVFQGVRRRQEWIGEAFGVRVYDDFAHHPRAVGETLAGIRGRHPEGRLLVAYEPRSATASRNLHQDNYPGAFAPADLTVLAPVGRPEISEAERLDTAAIAHRINAAGGEAIAAERLDDIAPLLASRSTSGDSIVLMSNGAFGGLHDRLLLELTRRGLKEREER